MLKLYGFPMSNYFSMLKDMLLEKEVDFEVVEIHPNQEADFLQKSPMGKVPLIETEQGFLSETSAIIDYMEEAYPAVSLYPDAAFERAKVKELMRIVEHYVEIPTHRVLGVLIGREVPQALRDYYEPILDRGLAALQNRAKFAPFIAGDRLTHADFFTFWSVFLGQQVAKTAYERDIVAEVDGLADWYRMMMERQITSKLAAESKAYLEQIKKSLVANP